ncbi:hypothetical protein J2X68_007599 [Streptomyces sp. 3330]|uniref:hypothetical protein n=1 Tax=Streptomyces sp. 3330 TaxID=2817755 RepID=UPI0028615339|nr:hypothetical protein [Streptomyces sp. 3330]MDR6980857.1 hypothetical protein [Streptomyces sp. 3330]
MQDLSKFHIVDNCALGWQYRASLKICFELIITHDGRDRDILLIASELAFRPRVARQSVLRAISHNGKTSPGKGIRPLLVKCSPDVTLIVDPGGEQDL